MMNTHPWFHTSRSREPYLPPREATCCFTGHRIIPYSERAMLSRRLDLEIAWLYSHGISHFVAGGALGFDTLAAQAVLRARKKAPDIQLHLYLPSPIQTMSWDSQDAALYNRIRADADTVSILGVNNSSLCMMQRNHAMVQASSFVVAYYDETSQIPGQPPRGGTYHTIQYARNQGIPVTNLHDKAPSELPLASEWNGYR